MDDRGVAGGLEWSDLAVVLAICRAGSLVGAGRLLGCSHTTVYRRINTIEDRAGVRFFERLPTGYVKTDAGEVAMRYAERIEGEFLALSREVLGRDTRLQGTVVVTAPDGFVARVLPPILVAFHREHPDVVIELLGGAAAVDLARREADVAIRATRKPPDESLGRKIGAFRFALYASPEHLAAAPDVAVVDRPLAILGNMEAWLVPQVFKTLPRAQQQVVFRANNVHGVIAAAVAGMGVAPLPCYLGDPVPGLVRVVPPLEQRTLELWVLTHPALRHTARVKVLMRFLAEALRDRASLFDGTSVD